MKLKHYDNCGQARFVTFCTHRRIPLLTNNLFCSEVTNAIKYVRQTTGFKLLAYVIMPEHVHLVIVPRPETFLGQLVGEIKRLSAKSILSHLRLSQTPLLDRLTVIRNGKTRQALWQRRCYDHNCRSDQLIWLKVNYCHSNPVIRGLAGAEADWQWSSYRWYHDLGEVDIDLDIP